MDTLDTTRSQTPLAWLQQAAKRYGKLQALDPAGAVSGARCSPEAAAARAAFIAARPLLYQALCDSASGRELLARGWEDDVATSAAHDVSTLACRLIGPEFRSL